MIQYVHVATLNWQHTQRNRDGRTENSLSRSTGQHQWCYYGHYL